MVKNGNFPITVYPPVNGQERFGTYQQPLIQTHPFLFSDERDAKQLVRAVKVEGHYAGVVADSFHMLGETNSGVRPFGQNETEIFKSLEILVKEGVLKGFYVQPGRLIDFNEDYDAQAELYSILKLDPNYNTPLGRMIRHLKSLGFIGPYTIEADLRAVKKLVGSKVLVPGNRVMTETLGAMVDYVKRP